ncbi:hypothetical protein AAZX31_06G157600 [Glycine max]|uniref:Transcription factor ICE1 isoform A n=1 Tax=Glycine soja TaxID=3848 RepID=A0A445KAN9_GLYSO|nr:transcription factor ICE1-like [Glycine soja]KAG5031874.1 hypothetical protein JHK85_015856 [Glycine max]KAG5019546.1 hypothetical protein JHK87_015401 [Glycine soja]KAG5046087.1 hypothetical protein JHK86_015493 [Glycine max]KAH1126263.1 hypothetical protein GYH30_015317 [Glycine max]KAH1126264.1 hypothetical protein GYH30_015317 [Glycine max]
MMSRINNNGVAWMGEREDENSRNHNIIPTDTTTTNTGFVETTNNDLGSLCAFKPMLDVDDEWYNNITNHHHHHHHHHDMTFDPDNLLLHAATAVDSSSSCSPYFFPPNPKPPFLVNPFDMGFLDPQASSSPSLPLLPESTHFTPPHTTTTAFAGFQSRLQESGSSKSLFLRPLESLPPSGAQPTLFQKRAALRKNMEGSDNNKKKRKEKEKDEEVEDLSFDGSGLNYDSDDLTESNYNNVSEGNTGKNGGVSSNANSTVITGLDQKGKKKGMPAKNLMAERRRRKKLNDRLYMLRSVVPKISKMDRASILGDAIEYLKELLQRINDLHNELESTPVGSSLTPVSSFHPLTPTPPTLPSRIKEELCPSSLPSPNGQPARVEVRLREGRAVNIHMFCARKPGLLLSTMRALDNLGLDIQQAVISCFNGFAMDIFRAEQCKEGQDVHPEQIKAVLLDSAGYNGMM